MSDEPQPQPVYDYERGILIVPDGWYDPPAGTHAIDTGLRTPKGHAIKIRKVNLSDEPADYEQQNDDSDRESRRAHNRARSYGAVPFCVSGVSSFLVAYP